MDEFKYCRGCLVTGVKMYSLDITSHESIGFIYSELTQIRICDNNQNICYECASLLQKFHLFKSKCLRANDVLDILIVNTAEITKEVIQGIDRKGNQLESHCKISKTETSADFNNVDGRFEENDHTTIHTEFEIKPEVTFETNPDNVITSDINENSFIEKVIPTKLKHKNVKDGKIKKLKSIKKKIVPETNNTCDNDESYDDFNDNSFIESSDENVLETPTKKHKMKIIKEPKTKKRKSKKKTNLCSDNYDLSDNEPLSKTVTKTTDIVEGSVTKKFNLNLAFFDNYATVVLLTPDEAKSELLSRKESSNYKRSQYKCDFCYKGYEAHAAFENHMKKHSNEHGDYECDICHLRFMKKIYLCKHKLSCHKRKFSCKLCPYICYCMDQARTHVSLHKGKKYPCKDCGEIFSMPNSLLMHKRMKHFDESASEYVCEFCGNSFGSARGLFLHIMKVHRTEKNSKQGPNCEECGVHFASDVAWKRHLVLSTKHIVINGCKYCGERFTNMEELKCHIRTNHPRVKREKGYDKKLPAGCPICNKRLLSRVEYNKHVTSEHPQSDEAKDINSLELTPFVCEVCGQAFKQHCFLTYHQRKHTGERPYSCAACGKTFQMAGALSIHRTVHTRNRVNKCDICARVFSFKSALNKHMKVHLGIRPHKCTICDKGFIHMCDLKLHIKYVHDKVPWPKRKSKRSADDNAPYLDTTLSAANRAFY